MTRTALPLLYAAFAIAATGLNLLVQRAVIGLAGYAPALLAGTVAGLLAKYALDRRWIFRDRPKGLAREGRQMLLYAATGTVTTGVFWGSETLAWALWGDDLAREAGAVLGLTAGYVFKFHLDRALVFPTAPAAGAGR